jgi:CheY-like chemotaxis protein
VTRQASSAGALSGWLDGAGYQVTVASSAAEAQRLEGPFDCAVFDYQLGDESGIVLAASLSAEDKLRTVVFCPEPIAADAATDDQKTMEQLLEVELNVAAALAEVRSLQNAA